MLALGKTIITLLVKNGKPTCIASALFKPLETCAPESGVHIGLQNVFTAVQYEVCIQYRVAAFDSSLVMSYRVFGQRPSGYLYTVYLVLIFQIKYWFRREQYAVN